MPSPTLPRAIERAFACLARVGESKRPVVFSELRGIMGGISDSNLARLLQALLQAGLLEKEGKSLRGYVLSKRCRDLGRAISGQSAPLSQRLRVLVDSLAAEVGQSVAVFEAKEEGLLAVVKKEVEHSITYLPEGTVRSHLGGHGCAQVLAAFNERWGRQFREQLCADLYLSPVQWGKRMKAIALKGYHLAHGEEAPLRLEGLGVRLPHLARLSIPILPDDGQPPVFCLSVGAQGSDLESLIPESVVRSSLDMVHGFEL